MELKPFEISSEINWGATGEEAAKQNVRFLLSVWQTECVLDQELGLSGETVDAPINNTVEALISSEIIQLIESREPYFRVQHVKYEKNEINGQLIPVVKVMKADGTV
ncbi:hypothetical protein BTO30_14840 [Domibacillus antri]|uniref:Uncharacterized protein n=1 Tax=Domibacillus antri TaxID=1714264 RepID=A0A1Q8Q225_9BACI|nr:hypothetical protein [Domibacillus antri]OLN21394.1 hypothetical protein BTO30_14840 [Domibacillus antri]